MSDPTPPSTSGVTGDPTDDRLDSWKEIASYLKRDVSTVQRWEKREGMPVHRHRHAALGSVYASRSELDEWRRTRRTRGPHAGPPFTRQLLRSDATERLHEANSPQDVYVPPLSAISASRHRSRKIIRTALIAVFIAGAATYELHGPGLTQAPVIRSLAVLPFDGSSKDGPRSAALDGIVEELTARLARIEALRVVSPRSVARAVEGGRSGPEIGRTLNVDALLQGSLTRVGQLVRIRIQLLYAPTGRSIWSANYQRELADVERLQADVARDMAEEIRIQITEEERARVSSAKRVNPAAYDEYLAGRYYLWKYTEADQSRALDHFHQAIQIDPGFAAAYAALAHAWWVRGVFGPLTLNDVKSPARAAAQRALELDPQLAEAHVANAYLQGMFDWDWSGAERTIKHALDLDPGSVDAHYVWAILLMAQARHAEAIDTIARAARLDPLSAQVQSTYGRVLYRARRFEEAMEHLNRAIELEPRNTSAYNRLADVLEQMGRHGAALDLYRKARALADSPRAGNSDIARVYARMGEGDTARRMLTQEGTGSAGVYAALGDRNLAFKLLFQAIDERIDWPLFVKADPTLDSLHDDARWPRLLARMNLSD